MEKLYSINEVIELLQVTQRTVYNYIKANQLKAVKIGSQWRIKESELNRFLNQGTDEEYLKTYKEKELKEEIKELDGQLSVK